VQAAIETSGLIKGFPARRSLAEIALRPFRQRRERALHGIDMVVPEGAVCALLGPNGAGKSTLLRIIAGVIMPDAGSVRVLGRDTAASTSELCRQVGLVVGDERSFYARLTARQNLAFFAALHDLHGREASERVSSAVEAMGLKAHADRPFSDLSSGMKQRVALARVLLADPKILLFDEITRGLDPGQARRFRSLLRDRVSGGMKRTVVFATHNLEEAAELADIIVLISDGRVAASGSMEDVRPRLDAVFSTEDAG
jgi:ABC-2 type transport system ATP-binding protein